MSAASCSCAAPAKRSSSELGAMLSATGGEKAARAAFQNALSANASDHHARHRASVCRLTPSSSRSWVARHRVVPCCIAVASTTTAPR